MEKRVLLAALLAGVVLVVWSALFSPPRPEPAPSVRDGGATAQEVEPLADRGVGRTEDLTEPETMAPPATARGEVIGGESGELLTLRGEGWSAEVDSAGAVIRSLVLEGYRDAEGRALNLVGETSSPPLSLAADGPWNREPYRVTREGESLRLEWSDGRGNWVEKEISPGRGRFVVNVGVRGGGRAWVDGVVVGGGINEAARSTKGGYFGRAGAVARVNGKVQHQSPAKVKDEKAWLGTVDFAGVEDQYFLLAVLPDERVREVRVDGGERTRDGRGRVVVFPGSEGLAGRLYAGPKEHHTLTGFGRGLEGTISFGIFGFFSVGFLAALRWIYSWAGNWGLAIILLTAAIRVPLFPLTHKSTVAMKRMQALKPKMDAIQERYKERAKKDPQVRNRMNQEVMALYKQEGVNPLGGCLPTLVQLPILWALYTLFAYAIELRQAPFMLWVQDLSVKDPFYVLPVLMTASMFLQQRLAPQVGDPAQRRMFMMMPLIFGIMFLSFPAGLVLYWLVNNVLTIGQQLLTERLMRPRATGT